MNWDDLEQFFATQRAVRRFDGRHVENSDIEKVLRAATRAPSARNSQPWRFIVIRELETKRQLGVIFDQLGAELYGHSAPDHTPWEEVPVLIAVCSEFAFGTSEAGVAALGASIYPAVQNLLLAAHGLGLGAVLTTRWKSREGDIRPLLGLPETMTAHAIIPIGWPASAAGRNRRRAIPEITYSERFGGPWGGV